MTTTVPKALPTIDPQRCTGCGWCIAVCPPHVLSLKVQGTGPWGPKCSTLHDVPGCTGCALCAVRCPFDAIHMVRVAAETPAAPKRLQAGALQKSQPDHAGLPEAPRRASTNSAQTAGND